MPTLDEFMQSCQQVEDGLLYHPDTRLFIRDRNDAWLIYTLRSDYGKCLEFEFSYRQKTVLDLGAAIGTFTWFALEKLGAGKVVAIEPLPAHLEVFAKNYGDDTRVELLPGVIYETDGRSLVLSVGKTFSHNSTITRLIKGSPGSITVRSYGFERVLNEVKPTLVKSDIEGSEYFLPWETMPDSVLEVVMEMHQRGGASWIERGRQLDNRFLAMGFRHVKAPRHQKVFNSRQMAMWSRR